MPPLSVAVHERPSPLTVTLPVGVPLPGDAAATRTLKVVAWPTRDGSGTMVVMVVAVPALSTW